MRTFMELVEKGEDMQNLKNVNREIKRCWVKRGWYFEKDEWSVKGNTAEHREEEACDMPISSGN